MEQIILGNNVAGIDVGKRYLDIAVHGNKESIRVENNAGGLKDLIIWLNERQVRRVGMEATGGYERSARAALDCSGFEVIVHNPLEIRPFARLKRQRAKNDAIDSVLIAAATAQTDTLKAAQDPRLIELAERLTAYDQISAQVAKLKLH